MKIVKEFSSSDGTVKRVHKMDDGCLVESVLIPHKTKTNLCISTQVGCKMRCAFCESGKKFVRNLTSDEILRQIDRPYGPGTAGGIDSVVFMGMGEPLDNPNVIDAIERVKKEKDIPSRKIVVSTAGMCDKIKLLLPTKVNIAISLNATTDDQRNLIMPINKRFPLAELKKAMHDVNDMLPSKRRLQIEYVMIKGFNDAVQDAERIAALVPKKSLINLIPVNSNDERFHPPNLETVASFKEALRKHGFICYVREPRGRDVKAACGMLAGKMTTPK
ncbi:23S rRNA (adenine(2503)-C(2))-methyltransferase RlmN [Candidatus Woesearchaeota archaeon]|nr:23S rRNA (adenine(2503)-C(2))-methyltransferase RlmN [Candidatus Woesearchaeota archaeon]